MCLVSSFPRIYDRKESRGVKEGGEDELGKGWRSFFRRVSSTKTEFAAGLRKFFVQDFELLALIRLSRRSTLL